MISQNRFNIGAKKATYYSQQYRKICLPKSWQGNKYIRSYIIKTWKIDSMNSAPVSSLYLTFLYLTVLPPLLLFTFSLPWPPKCHSALCLLLLLTISFQSPLLYSLLLPLSKYQCNSGCCFWTWSQLHSHPNQHHSFSWVH